MTDTTNREADDGAPEPPPLTITESDGRVTVSDGTHAKTFRKHKLGLVTYGGIRTAEWIEQNRDELTRTGLTASQVNVILGVSENEGNLDAINTWDSAFLSFGLFQWTLGTGDAKGELPALLAKVRAADAAVFDACYGRYGLETSPDTTATHGFLLLAGILIGTPELKEPFRRPEWAFRFWRAALDPVVQRVSVAHALARIGTFARTRRYRVHGHDLADIVTSEYGMALVLDNHVNRPAYVAGCLAGGVDAAGLAGSDPAQWSTADERRLIAQYLRIRVSYGRWPMTHAARRAEVTRRYLDDGILSDERGSFKTGGD